MADIVDKKTRSRMMSGIRGKNTKPELLIRKALFARGFRYKLHDKQLPGKPDLVFPKYRAIIFIHGCFWHRHDCHLFKMPKTNTGFWQKKLNRNQEVDHAAARHLRQQKWRVLTIWECSLKGKNKLNFEKLINLVDDWLKYPVPIDEIKGEEL